jgi:hypothetical protein
VVGQYRVSVDGSGNTTFTVRAGSADLLAPQGAQVINAGLTVVIHGTSSHPVIRPVSAVAYDDFDSWNAQRDQYAQQAYNDRNVNADIVGADDLGAYGHWVDASDYGNVWVPYNVAPGWAPYHYGRWVWEPYYGWTWVAAEPWGWAPYHYGRWFYSNGYGWAWSPGPVYVRPVYRPALVAFFGFGAAGSSFAFGNVGWVPLAPYEPFHPWWGPGYMNRTVVYNNTTINITRVYRNAAVSGGIAVVSHANFTDGTSYHYVAVHPQELHTVSLAKNTLPIVPTRQNLSLTKTDGGHSVAAAPLSPHFQRMSAPAKLPSSFDTQRETVQTSMQHNNSSAPGAFGGSSAWDRFDSNRGTKTHGATAGANAPAHQPNSSDPWSKFAPENNKYITKPSSTSHHGVNEAHHTKKPKAGGSQKPSGGTPARH